MKLLDIGRCFSSQTANPAPSVLKAPPSLLPGWDALRAKLHSVFKGVPSKRSPEIEAILQKHYGMEEISLSREGGVKVTAHHLNAAKFYQALQNKGVRTGYIESEQGEKIFLLRLPKEEAQRKALLAELTMIGLVGEESKGLFGVFCQRGDDLILSKDEKSYGDRTSQGFHEEAVTMAEKRPTTFASHGLFSQTMSRIAVVHALSYLAMGSDVVLLSDKHPEILDSESCSQALDMRKCVVDHIKNEKGLENRDCIFAGVCFGAAANAQAAVAYPGSHFIADQAFHSFSSKIATQLANRVKEFSAALFSRVEGFVPLFCKGMARSYDLDYAMERWLPQMKGELIFIHNQNDKECPLSDLDDNLATLPKNSTGSIVMMTEDSLSHAAPWVADPMACTMMKELFHRRFGAKSIVGGS